MNQSQDDLFAVDPKSLQKVDFPVEFRDVYVDFGSGCTPAGACHVSGKVKQAKHQAVVDVEKGYTFAIVSTDYQIITNGEAIELAAKCFQSVFQLTDASDMEMFNVIMPSTRSQCHIDFLHKKCRFGMDDSDPWAPFIRVSNSFNRSRALKFDLGFCRGICRNGLIFGKESIEFKFTHSRGVVGLAEASFQLKAGEFGQLEAQFLGRLKNLQRFHVPRKYMWPLLCKVFQLREPREDASAKVKDAWEKQRLAVNALTEHYFNELDSTGYAALSVLTDFATRPPAANFGALRVHGFQSASGLWIEKFVEAIRSDQFNFKSYLGEYYSLAA